MAVTFGTEFNVEVFRPQQSGEPLGRVFTVGGDMDRLLLFRPDTDIKRSDLVVFPGEDARIVLRKRPQIASGEISYYEADLEHLSDYEERQRSLNRAPIHQVVHGNVGNLSAVSGSTQTTITQNYNACTADIAISIDEMVALVKASNTIDVDTKADYEIDAEQLKTELKRPKLDSSRIWTLLDRLSKLKGAIQLSEVLWSYREKLEILLHNLGL